MNLRIDPAVTPVALVYTAPDDEFIKENLENTEGDEAVAAYARRVFLASNPGAVGAEARLTSKQSEVKGLERRLTRLEAALEQTPLLKHSFPRGREHRLSAHDCLKYYMFQVGAVGGMALATHVTATYIANSDLLPDLTGHYYQALPLAATPYFFALALKALGVIPDLEDDRRRYARYLRTAVIAGGCSVLVAMALAFAPHVVDPAALTLAISSGTDPDGPVVGVIRKVAPYALTLTSLFAEVSLAAVLAMGADAVHEAGRVVEQQFSDRGMKLQAEIDSLNKRIAELNLEAAVAAKEVELLAAAERDAVHAAVSRRTELKKRLDQHLTTARNSFKSKI